MVTTVFISFIVGVAALNIVASQIMIVMNKTRDIAILRSMGASAKSIHAHLHAPGRDHRCGGDVHRRGPAELRSRGCFDHYRLVTIPEDVYQVAWVPFKLLPADFLLVVLAAPLICFPGHALSGPPCGEVGDYRGACDLSEAAIGHRPSAISRLALML